MNLLRVWITLPDDWGRRLIVAEQRLPRQQQGPYWIMRAVGGNGLGALSFATGSKPPARTRPTRALAELAAAAVATLISETPALWFSDGARCACPKGCRTSPARRPGTNSLNCSMGSTCLPTSWRSAR